MKTIFEKSQQGQRAWSLPKSDSAFEVFQPKITRKDPIPLPEISELDLTRHFVNLSRLNMGIDTHFYPLGSCTMKLNPRINEKVASLPGFQSTHPLAPVEYVQGNLQLMFEFIDLLCQITGMEGGSLLPNAGAQGEFTAIKMMAAYHVSKGDTQRTEMLIPDSAHGTNPASAAMAGYKIISIRSNDLGDLDMEHLKENLSERTAGLMMTNPNTLGIFSPNILTISKLVHDAGGLLFYDGANLNAILNICRPGAMGFDILHLNLHKTFSTPHGGGGPGSGPVLCKEFLKPFLPVPRVIKNKEGYGLEWEAAQSIGFMASFHGNFGIYLRAYLYAKLHGHYGLRRIAENAVANANYLKHYLSKFFKAPYPQHCMHEFVLQADRYLDKGIRALDIAKRLLDYEVYAPTIYFPLTVKECMLVEPTETESKTTLDHFISIFGKIVEEIENNPDIVKNAPHRLPVKRLDEVLAAKHPILNSIC